MVVSTYGTSFVFPYLNISKTPTKHPVCLISVKAGNKSILVAAIRRRNPRSNWAIMASSAIETEILGIKLIKSPPEAKLTELGVRSWPKWGCPPSKFPWTYSSRETCYVLEGKVKVYPDGSDEGVEIEAGDFVVFPKGMSCTWDVSETIDKHYKFD